MQFNVVEYSKNNAIKSAQTETGFNVVRHAEKQRLAQTVDEKYIEAFNNDVSAYLKNSFLNNKADEAEWYALKSKSDTLEKYYDYFRDELGEENYKNAVNTLTDIREETEKLLNPAKILAENGVFNRSTLPEIEKDWNKNFKSKFNPELFKNMYIPEYETIKEKLQNAKGLTASERETAEKHGLDIFFDETYRNEFDMLSPDADVNIRYRAAAENIVKNKKPEELTEDEKNLIATSAFLRDYRKARLDGLLTLSGDAEELAAKANTLKTLSEYNKAAYGKNRIIAGGYEKKIDPNNNGDVIAGKLNELNNRLQLYMKAGVSQYFTGVTNTADIIKGDSEKVKQKLPNEYMQANQLLREKLLESEKTGQIILQDIVTNISANAAPMIVGAVSAGTGNIPSSLLAAISMGLSVFGNSYKEACDMGVTDEGRLVTYAFANAAMESGLQFVLGGLPGAKGVLTGDIIKGLSKNVSGIVLKSAVKILGSATGEFIEESIQSIISPLLQRFILNKETEDILNNPGKAVSNAFYDGFIGFASAVITGGLSGISEAVNESNIENYGRHFKTIFKQNGFDIIYTAGYLKQTANGNKALVAAANNIISGDSSDFAVGKLMLQAKVTLDNSTSFFNKMIGESFKDNIGDIIRDYEKAIESGLIYPPQTHALYKSIKEDMISGKSIQTESVGRFVTEIRNYFTRALFMREVVFKFALKLGPYDSQETQRYNSQHSTNETDVNHGAYSASENRALPLLPAADSRQNAGQNVSGYVLQNGTGNGIINYNTNHIESEAAADEFGGGNRGVRPEVLPRENDYVEGVRQGSRGYIKSDEFRRLQASSQGMPENETKLYRRGDRTLDEGLRERFSRSVRSLFMVSEHNGLRNDSRLLNLSDGRGNRFNIYENVDGGLFHDVFEIARRYLKNGELVDLHDAADYENCANYLSEDGLSGFSITPEGDLISVFNASGRSGFLRSVAPVVKERAKTLDCYNSDNQPLMTMYSDVFGFKTASIMDYNMEYDHDGIAENHGSPQIAFMVNTDAPVEERYFTKEQYGEAKAYRDGFIYGNSAASEETASFADGVWQRERGNSALQNGTGNGIINYNTNHIESEAAVSGLGGGNREIGTSVHAGGRTRQENSRYIKTDKFRGLQRRLQGIPEKEFSLYRSGDKSPDDGILRRLSGVLSEQLELVCGKYGNNNGLLKLSAKGNQFNIYENVDGELFHDVFEIARCFLENGELVDLHDAADYENCANYISEDGLSGFSITPEGDLISVFNASRRSGFLRSVAPVVKAMAKTLDCYISNKTEYNLRKTYVKTFGFKTASVMDYNMEYDHDGIAENHGSPKIAFMVNTDAPVEERYFTKEQYDEAKAYRDGFIHEDSRHTVDNPGGQSYNESIRGDIDAGTEKMDYNGKQVRGENRGSGGQAGAVLQNTEGNAGSGSENSRRSGSRVLRVGDGRRRNLIHNEAEALKGTAVIEADGEPKRLYHYTADMDFTEFAKGDTGFHFGTKEQALARSKGKSGRVMAVCLNIEKPYKVPIDLNSWQPSHLALRLYSDGIISLEEYQAVIKMQLENGIGYASAAAVELRRLFAQNGYDGVEYENMFEGDGKSYIAFYPEQVIVIDDGLGGIQMNNDIGADFEETASFADGVWQRERGDSALQNGTGNGIINYNTNHIESEAAADEFGGGNRGVRPEVLSRENYDVEGVRQGSRGYIKTDEFRRLQASSKEVSENAAKLFHAGDRTLDEGLRRLLSGIFRRQLESFYRIRGNGELSPLRLQGKGKQFNVYENADGELFHDVFEIARRYLKNGELVDLHDAADYENCANYLSEDGLSGFSITPDGDLISVFNASGKTGFLYAIAPIVKERAKTLDCYNSERQKLKDIYTKTFGFKTASVMDYNMEYDHDNIAENHGSPQIAFMVNTDAPVEERYFTKEQYGEAKAYRDGFIHENGGQTDLPEGVRREVVSLNNGNRARHRLNEAEQDYVKRIAGAFGVNVIFENVVKITGVDGDSYYDSHGNIHMDFSVVDPINILIKHELTHFGEDGKLYDSFVRAVKKSSAYKMWLDSQIPGEKSTAEKAAEYRESVMQRYRAAGENISPAGADAELIAHFAADNLFTGNGSGLDALIRQANAKDRPVLIQWIIDLINSVKSLFKGQYIPMEVLRLERKYTAMLKAAENALAENGANNYADGGSSEKIRFSLRDGAEADVDNALFDIKYRDDVYLTESSPSIIASQRGVRNLPMLMKASHIRENVFTEQEAEKLGLKVNKYINYHGLGKELFLKIIGGLDDVKLAYRGTKNADDPARRENYFLLISQYKDANGNTINVPVYINEKGQYNRVFIDTNKIATVFGRNDFNEYINREIRKGNLVRIKSKSIQASERTALIAGGYSKNAFTDYTVPQSDTESQDYSMPGSEYINREIRKGNLVRIKSKSTQASERTSPINASYDKSTLTDYNVPQSDTESQDYSMPENEKNSAEGGNKFSIADRKITADIPDGVRREVVSLNNGNRPRHRLNEAEQDYVKRIAGAFGVNVIFENVVKITGVDGDSYYDSHGNIHMDFSVVDPINILIKHELTHFGEDGKLYDSFVRAVKKSSAYKMWLDSQIPGEKSTAEKAAEYRESVMQRYRAAGENISPAGADAELIAHFAADNLFAGNGSGLDALIRQANAKDRPVLIQWIIDLINSVKSLFKGQYIPMEVLRLERKYTAMLKAAENALAANGANNYADGGNKFSIAFQNADINSKLLEEIDNVERGSFNPKKKIVIGTVSQEQAEIIRAITGINTNGYNVLIESRQIDHIIKEHGKNGKTDHSLADYEVIGKMPFVIEGNYNIVAAGVTRAYVSYVNGKNKPAKTVLYEKQIGDNSYYVVEAVPDTSNNAVYIVTAFIGKPEYKKETLQSADAKYPGATPKSEAVNVSNNTVPQSDTESQDYYMPENEKNTAENGRKFSVAAGGTGVNLSKDISDYPYNMQTVIKEYMNSVDEAVERFIKTFNSNNRFARHKISDVTEGQAADVKRLLGIDVNGFTNAINTNAIRHIEKRHGKNGIADSSMSNISDIARVGYVLENYDNVEIAKNGLDEVNSAEFRNSENEPAPMLVFSKKINGTYYVAQVIPDSEYKKLWVVSAYISKKEAGTQALNSENESHHVGMSLASSASTDSIPNSSEKVKKFSIPDDQSAVKASEKFNNDIGADFEEPAFFAPESSAVPAVDSDTAEVYNKITAAAVYQKGHSSWLENKNQTSALEEAGLFDEAYFLRLSEMTVKNTDTAGRSLSYELQRRLEHTAMKTSDGRVLSLYHWTAAEFTDFAKGDFGFHFGTFRAAQKRRIGLPDGDKTGYYKEVYLNIKSPLFIEKDVGGWSADDFAKFLLLKGVITENDRNIIKSFKDCNDTDYNSEAVTELREMLKKKGCDGIVYYNKVEGDYSVIAFDPQQVITVAENGVTNEEVGVTEPQENYGGDNYGNQDPELLAGGEISAFSGDRNGIRSQGENSGDFYVHVAETEGSKRRSQNSHAGGQNKLYGKNIGYSERGNVERRKNLRGLRGGFAGNLRGAGFFNENREGSYGSQDPELLEKGGISASGGDRNGIRSQGEDSGTLHGNVDDVQRIRQRGFYFFRDEPQERAGGSENKADENGESQRSRLREGSAGDLRRINSAYENEADFTKPAFFAPENSAVSVAQPVDSAAAEVYNEITAAAVYQKGHSSWLENNNQTSALKDAGLFDQAYFRRLSEMTVKNTDTAGRSLSYELQRRLEYTAMKTSDGRVLSLYHWTAAEFTDFAKGEFGFHFGTFRAAYNRKDDISGGVDGYYKEVYLNIKNPLYLAYDPRVWKVKYIVKRLYKMHLISGLEHEKIRACRGFYSADYNSEAAAELRVMLKNKGYDGIVYKNKYEGDYSVIAFDPRQVITVAENGVTNEEVGVTQPEENYKGDNYGNQDPGLLERGEISAPAGDRNGIRSQGEGSGDFYGSMAGDERDGRRSRDASAGKQNELYGKHNERSGISDTYKRGDRFRLRESDAGDLRGADYTDESRQGSYGNQDPELLEGGGISTPAGDRNGIRSQGEGSGTLFRDVGINKGMRGGRRQGNGKPYGLYGFRNARSEWYDRDPQPQGSRLREGSAGDLRRSGDAARAADFYDSDIYEAHKYRGDGESVGKRSAADTGGAGADARAWRETQEAFKGRIQSDTGQTGRGRRVLLRYGNTLLAYYEKQADGTPAGRAAARLSSYGVEAVYCEGAVEVNHNGITRRCTEALTAADGTVFVSSLTTLSEIEIASHEIVHFNERKNTAAYNDYKSAVCENLLFASDTFKRICHEINENHYDGRYDVEDVDYAEKFLREILAYLNEFTTTDPDSAYRRFSGMFKDWQSAVKASEKFNNDIGADFEESAFFAPENGESLMHEPSDRELALNKSLEEEFAAGVQNRGTLSAAQQYVKNLAELFGVNLEWTDDPRIEEGFYNRRTRTIVLSTGPDTVESLIRVFGHELAHYLESCKLYGKFVKYLTGQSKSFAKFVETRLADYGVDTDGTQSRLDALLDAIVKKRKASKVMSENARRNFGRDSALYELAADFIGHKVFGECDMEAVREIVTHQPTVFERIMDWIRSLIRRITGDKRFATARSDMEYILGYLNRVYHSRRTQSSEVSPGRYNRDSDTAYAGNTAESLIEDGDNQYSLPIRPDKNIFEEYANGDITRDEAMAELDDYVKHVRTLKEKRLSSENAEPLKAFDKNVYGFNLQLWRLSRGMSREELAIWLQMSEKGVRKIERGNSNPELASLAKIAELTGISIEEMSSPDFIIDVPGLKQVLTEYLNGKTNYQQRDAKAKELIEKSGYSDSRELEEMWDVLAPEIPAAGTNIFRRLLGMNQTEFGEEIGVAINTVANIEKNMYDLDGAAIANVSQIAEVSLNDFMSNPIIADEELVRKLNIIARRYYTGKINEVSFKNALINLLDDYAPQGHEKSGISLAEGTVNNAEPERPFADGWRNSKAYVLNDEEIAEIKKEIRAIGADESVFVFNYGTKTGYSDKKGKIHIKGDILPDIYSKHPRDRLSIRAVLAHEYYGHWTYREKPFEIGSWRDEFRASYMAAKNAPGLTDEDRRFLVLDAVTRANEACVPIQYNEFMFKTVYGR